mmetsp:Transcript_36983/g.94454  ORF Transcript_36983/g.94454 Transcript_36983/m.94454 type:complete len:201 (-) Transcript_36983:311-913(-)
MHSLAIVRRVQHRNRRACFAIAEVTLRQVIATQSSSASTRTCHPAGLQMLACRADLPCAWLVPHEHPHLLDAESHGKLATGRHLHSERSSPNFRVARDGGDELGGHCLPPVVVVCRTVQCLSMWRGDVCGPALLAVHCHISRVAIPETKRDEVKHQACFHRGWHWIDSNEARLHVGRGGEGAVHDLPKRPACRESDTFPT